MVAARAMRNSRLHFPELLCAGLNLFLSVLMVSELLCRVLSGVCGVASWFCEPDFEDHVRSPWVPT